MAMSADADKEYRWAPPAPPAHLAGHPHALRLGMSWFSVPPTAIQVDTISTTQALPMLRARGSVKSQSGHADTRVTMEILFPDLDAVNDPDHGLRALIAQFRRTPLVPVENAVLNDMGIYALALHNLTYRTLPQFPQSVQAMLTAFAFDAAAYIPEIGGALAQDDGSPEGIRLRRALDRQVVWPLWKWYVQRGLMAGVSLPPPTPDNSFVSPEEATRLYAVQESELHRLAFYRASPQRLERLYQARLQALMTSIDARPTSWGADTGFANFQAAIQRARDPKIWEENDPQSRFALRMAPADRLTWWGRGTVFTPSWWESLPLAPGHQRPMLPADRPVRVVLVRIPVPWSSEPWVKWRRESPWGRLWDFLVEASRALTARSGEVFLGPDGRRKPADVPVGDLQSGLAFLLVQKSDGTFATLEEAYPGVWAFGPYGMAQLEELLKQQSSSAIAWKKEQEAARRALQAPESILAPEERVDLGNLLATRIQVSYTNILARLPLSGRTYPVYQYLGGQDHLIQIDAVATSHRDLVALQEAYAYSQEVARTYRLHGVYNFLRVDNPLLNVAGIRYVLLDSFSASSIEGYPDAYRVEMSLVDFDAVQRRRFAPKAIVGTTEFPGSQGQEHTMRLHLLAMTQEEANSLQRQFAQGQLLSGVVAVPGSTGSSREGSRQVEWALTQDFFRAIDPYPDLELPTWLEVFEALDRGDIVPKGDPSHSRIRSHLFSLLELSKGSWEQPGLFCDPDFYMRPSAVAAAVSDQEMRKLFPGGAVDPNLQGLFAFKEMKPLDQLQDPQEVDRPPSEDRLWRLDPSTAALSPVAPPQTAPATPRESTASTPPPSGSATQVREWLLNTIREMGSEEHGPPYLSALPVGPGDSRLRFDETDLRLLLAVARVLTEFAHAIPAENGEWVWAEAPKALWPEGVRRVGLFGLPEDLLPAERIWERVGHRGARRVQWVDQLRDVAVEGRIRNGRDRFDRWLATPRRRMGINDQGQLDPTLIRHTLWVAVGLYWTLVALYGSSVRTLPYVGNAPIEPSLVDALESAAASAATLLIRAPELLGIIAPGFWDPQQGGPSARFLEVAQPHPGGGKDRYVLLGVLDWFFSLAEIQTGWWLRRLRLSYQGGQAPPRLEPSAQPAGLVPDWVLADPTLNPNAYEDVERVQRAFTKILARFLLYLSGVVDARGNRLQTPVVPRTANAVPMAKVLAAAALLMFREPSTVHVGWEGGRTWIDRLVDAYGHATVEPDELAVLPLSAGETRIEDLFRPPFPKLENPVDELVRSMTEDMRFASHQGRWLRAFPTFYAFLIDEGFPMIWWKRAWDNFYGFGALLSVRVHKTRESPVDTCVMEVANNYPVFVSWSTAYLREKMSFEQASFWEVFFGALDPKKVEAMRSRPLTAFWVMPGARLHLRFGYGSNVAALPVVFNGTITEIETGQVVQVVAQGDGLELVHEVDLEGSSTTNLWGGGTPPHTLLERLMELGFARGFVEEAKRQAQRISPVWYNPPIVHFGAGSLEILGEAYGRSEVLQNIYPASYGRILGYEEPAEMWRSGSFLDPALEVNTRGLTVWDVAALCARAVPGFISAVHPFEFRSTLFFGKPYWPITYAYDRRYVPTASAKLTKEQMRQAQEAFAREMHQGETLARGPFVKIAESSTHRIYLRGRRKAFSQYHLALSGFDLVRANLRLSSDFYTGVVLTYDVSPAPLIGGGPQQVAAYLDITLPPPFQKILAARVPIQDLATYTYPGGIPVLGGLVSTIFRYIIGLPASYANRVFNYTYTRAVVQQIAAATLRDEVAKMYDGDLLLVGDSTIKPYDYIYLLDLVEGYAGTLGVREVTHIISPETGFISVVVPDAVAMVPEVGSFVVHKVMHDHKGWWALRVLQLAMGLGYGAAGVGAAARAPAVAGRAAALVPRLGFLVGAAGRLAALVKHPAAMLALMATGTVIAGGWLKETLRGMVTAHRSVVVMPIRWRGFPWIAVLSPWTSLTAVALPHVQSEKASETLLQVLPQEAAQELAAQAFERFREYLGLK